MPVCQFSLSKKWRLVLIPLFLLVAGIISSFISTADSAAKNCLPLMDDSWFSALTTIKKYTPPGSVINSWWDFGDWFMSVADRPVIFDGQTQNTPQAYWMARAILADSEKESVGILRMLNNGGNKAFDIIDKYVGNPFMSVSLLKRAVLLDSDEGSVLFGKYLPADAVKEACQILYSRPEQKAYFIVDSSMIGKITAISFLGNWDFNKVYLSRAIRVKSKDQILRDLLFYGLDQSQAQAYYQEASLMASRDFNSWVSRRMSISGIAYQKKSEDGLVLFNNGYIYNPEKKTIYSYSSYEERYRIPRSLFMADGNNITEEVFSGSDSSQSAMVIRFGEMYKLLLMSPELARSVFVRLQFFNGRGLNHFVPFIREGPADNQILVYEVKWD